MSYDLGGWFTATFGVLRRNFWRLTAIVAVEISLIFVVVAMAFGAMILTLTGGAAEWFVTGRTAVGQVLGAGPWLAGGSMVLVMVIIGLILIYGQLVSFAVATLDANGEHTAIGHCLRIATRWLLPTFGRLLLAVLISAACVSAPVALAIGSFLSGHPVPGVLCVLLAIVIWIYLWTVLASGLPGVVLFEGAGIGRCFALVNARFWPTLGRVLLAWLLRSAYEFALGIVFEIVAFAVIGIGAGMANSQAMPQFTAPMIVCISFFGLIYLALLVPSYLFFTASSVTTYAWLRASNDPGVSTASLAASLNR